jgi:hypothetical protein
MFLVPPHHTKTMTTEEKIKAIIKKAIKDTLIVRSWNEAPEDKAVKDIVSLIKEAKIKMLEELMWDNALCETRESDTETVKGIYYQRRDTNRVIGNFIRELKLEGKENL